MTDWIKEQKEHKEAFDKAYFKASFDIVQKSMMIFPNGRAFVDWLEKQPRKVVSLKDYR